MSYTVVKADLVKHKQDIISIWERNYPGIIQEKYSWIYENAPAGPAHVWLLKHTNTNRYVGVTAVFPNLFCLNGFFIKGGIAGDFLIDKAHRSLGPALIMQRTVTSFIDSGALDFVYGFPNDKSVVILKKTGYQKLGEMVRVVNILRSRLFLSTRMTPALHILISSIVDTLMHLRFILRKIINTKIKKHIQIVELEKIPKNIDIILNKKNNIISPFKNKKFLHWKYNEIQKIVVIAAVTNDGIKGYLSYRVNNSTAEIIDYSWMANDDIIASLFIKLENTLRKNKIEKIECSFLVNGNIMKTFKKHGYFHRQANGAVFVHLNTEIREKYTFLGNRKNWVLFQSDDDM